MVIGIVICIVFAFAATYLGDIQHFVGAPMIGLFLGMIISNVFGECIIKRAAKGASFSSKYLLKTGIILAGGTLSFKSILGVGLSALPIIIFNICLSIFAAWIIGKAMKVSGNTRILVGSGTAICGGTAIATLAPVVEAEEHEMAYSMTAIFLFDIFAAILWPYAANAMHLTAQQYGIIGGLAISDTSSVTAAGATFDTIAGAGAVMDIGGEMLSGGDMAVIVKLTRTVMLVIVVIAVMFVRTFRKAREEEKAFVSGASILKRTAKAFPLFVLGFLAMALINTLVGFSQINIASFALTTLLSKGYKFFITTALVGVGFKIKIKELFTEGRKPVLLGGCTWATVALSTLCYVLFLT